MRQQIPILRRYSLHLDGREAELSPYRRRRVSSAPILYRHIRYRVRLSASGAPGEAISRRRGPGGDDQPPEFEFSPILEAELAVPGEILGQVGHEDLTGLRMRHES